MKCRQAFPGGAFLNAFNRGWISPFNLGMAEEGRVIQPLSYSLVRGTFPAGERCPYFFGGHIDNSAHAEPVVPYGHSQLHGRTRAQTLGWPTP